MSKASHTLIVAAVVGLPNLAPAQTDVQMQTIEWYVSQNNFTTNPGAINYVYMRCSGLYVTIAAAVGGDQNTASSKALGQQFQSLAARFLAQAAANEKSKDVQGYVAQVKRISDLYTLRFQDSKAKTGNFSDDALVKSDTASCKALAEGKKG